MLLIRPRYEILTPVNGPEILRFLERCGRVCYKSEENITLGSATRFCGKILQKNHLSVIEHVTVTVRFIVNRGVSHELVRHRIGSYSQESTRYCNYAKKGVVYIIPPQLSYEDGWEPDENDSLSHPWLRALRTAEVEYLDLLKSGWTPQQARDVLPHALKTEIIATYNLREWQHVFALRCDKAAHPQMREVMLPLQRYFHVKLPELFPVCFDYNQPTPDTTRFKVSEEASCSN